MPRVHGIDLARRRRHVSFADSAIFSSSGFTSESSPDATEVSGAEEASAAVSSAAKSPVFSPSKNIVVDAKVGNSNDAARDCSLDTMTRVNVMSDSSNCNSSNVTNRGSRHEVKVSSASKIMPLSKDALEHIEFSSKSFSVPILTPKDTDSPQNREMERLEIGCNGIAPPLDRQQVTVRKEVMMDRMMLGNFHDDDAQFRHEKRDNCHGECIGNIDVNETASSNQYDTSDAAPSKDKTVESNQTKTTEPEPRQKPLPETSKDASGEFSARKQSRHVNPHSLWLYNRCATALNAMQTGESPLDLGLKILNTLEKSSEIDKAHESQEDLSKLQHRLFVSIGGGKRRDLNLVFDVCEKREVLRDFDMKESLMEVASMKEFEGECSNAVDSGDGEEIVNDSVGMNAGAISDTAEKQAYHDGISNGLASMAVTSAQKVEAYNAPINDGVKRTVDLNIEVVEDDQTQVSRKPETHLNSAHESESLKEANLKANALKPPIDDETESSIHDKRAFPKHLRDDMMLQNAPSAFKKDASISTNKDAPKQPYDYNSHKNAASSSKKPRSRHKKRSSCKLYLDFDPAVSKDDIGMVDSKSMGSTSNHTSPLKIDDDATIPEDFPVSKHGLEMHDDIEWSFVPSDVQVAQGAGVSSPSRRVTRSMGSLASNQSEEYKNSVREKLQEHGVDSPSVNRSVNPRDENDDAACVAAPNNDISTLEEKPVQEGNSKVATKQKSRGLARKDRGAEASSNGSEEEEEGDSNGSLVIHNKSRRKRSYRRGPVRVMFTGFNPTQLHKQMIRSIGAELVENVEDAATATHIIPIISLTHFPFYFSKVSKILNIKWLEESCTQQQLLDTKDFLHVDDAEAEKRYSFSMRETIQNGNNVRRARGGVLGGRWIYICKGVAGNLAPSTKELHLIIEAAGGAVLRSLSSSLSYDPAHMIIITSDPRTHSQLNENGIEQHIANGAKMRTTSWLFHTIITQRFDDIDDHRNTEPCDRMSSKNDGSHFSRLVRCESHESLVSTLSVSPVKRSGRSALGRKRNVNKATDASICSVSSRGSMVSHLEYAQSSSQSKRRRKEIETNGAPKLASKNCKQFLSRDQFLSMFLPLTKPSSSAVDTAETQTRMLWATYLNKVESEETTPKVPKVTKGIRCRRGRKRTLSPLVTCTSTIPGPVISEGTPRSEKKVSPTTPYHASASKSSPDIDEYLSWEAYVLFTIRARAATLERNRDAIPLQFKPAIHTFPRPVAIDYSMKKLCLIVETNHGPAKFPETTQQQVFGTLQDVFDLHRKYQTSGPIPESVLAQLAILAIQAVSTMHACGVVHNEISLNSFLIVRASACESSEESSRDHESQWYLQIIGFGYKSLVLNCQQLASENIRCEDGHFEHDYKGLANVVHVLITGGMPITLTEVFGRVEFTSKAFLKGNLFLRGALSWCALLDALMGIGDDFDLKPIQLHYPFDVFKVEPSDSNKDARRLVEKETRLKAEAHTLARREANYRHEISEIHKKLEENRTLYESNLEIERRIVQKETELLRKEAEIASEEAHIKEIKEGLLVLHCPRVILFRLKAQFVLVNSMNTALQSALVPGTELEEEMVADHQHYSSNMASLSQVKQIIQRRLENVTPDILQFQGLRSICVPFKILEVLP
ncbi:hypothetical protein HJC23_011607 [Cyclotella cryptica]|uniref:BRCT domain-containing protein n=1 Tax=Cyclotella cryptica TaxID=29204 RepID=A0ABD3QS23_9STRA